MSVLKNDSKLSDGEAPVMLELCWMWSNTSLLLLPGPLWSAVVSLDRVLSMDQIESFDIQTVPKQMTDAKFNF